MKQLINSHIWEEMGR